MKEQKISEETQALYNLITIGQEEQKQRYKQHNTEYNNQSFENTYDQFFKRKISGKQNFIPRKHMLPKLKTSKEELKMILRKLESDDLIVRDGQLKQRTLRPLQSIMNQAYGNVATILKTARQNDIENCKDYSGKTSKKYHHTKTKTINDCSQFNANEEGKAEEIRFLVRKNNYSANALNMKTLNILHELNTRNNRCSSSMKNKKIKEPEPIKMNKRNVIAFLRKVS